MSNPEINLGEIPLIGIEVRTNNASAVDIIDLWQRFYTNGIQDRIANCIDSRLFGVYSHYENAHNGDYSYMIGCPVSDMDDIPQGMVGRKIPAQSYRVVRAEGALPDALTDAWLDIRKSDIKRAFSYDFEIYDDRAADANNAEVDIFIALA